MLNSQYKNIVNTKLCKYWSTFDNTLELKETNYYKRGYNNYGLFSGYGILEIPSLEKYSGNLVNGIKNGYGKMKDSSDYEYTGEWEDLKLFFINFSFLSIFHFNFFYIFFCFGSSCFI